MQHPWVDFNNMVLNLNTTFILDTYQEKHKSL